MTARVMVVAGLLGLSVLLAGCSSDDLANDFGAGAGDYSATGGATVLAEKDRGESLDFEEKTIDGTTLALSDLRGQVVVVNFWYAGCAPCRAEAPILEGLYQDYANKGVSFVGVNTVDQAATALSFEKKYGISYPSVLDVESGAARIAFAGEVSPSAVPTTFVLDREGRIAARVVGQLESKSILNTLISETLAER
ncbi:TlpA disulfide reductase family protein [soil metagenome]